MLLEAVVSQQLIPTADGNGRVAAFEIMLMKDAIGNLIREAKSHQIPSIIQTSKQDGMIMMDDAICELYMRQKIDRDNALSFAQDPNSLRKKLY